MIYPFPFDGHWLALRTCLAVAIANKAGMTSARGAGRPESGTVGPKSRLRLECGES